MYSYSVFPVADENGNLVRKNPNKPDFGSIRMTQRSFVLRGGFLNAKNKTSFLAGKYDDLLEFANATKLVDGKEIPGKLYTVESFEKFYEDQQPKINPTTGNAVLVGGALVYQQTFYDASGTREDSLFEGPTSVGPFIGVPSKEKEISIESSTLSTQN